MNDMRNPIAKARGMGSAKSGLHHWKAQRASAVILLLFIPWLVWSLVKLTGTGHAEAAEFLATPWNATLLILVFVCMLYHAMLGLQVVIEDYVHSHALSLIMLFAVRIGAVAAMIAGVIHVLKLVLGT